MMDALVIGLGLLLLFVCVILVFILLLLAAFVIFLCAERVMMIIGGVEVESTKAKDDDDYVDVLGPHP